MTAEAERYRDQLRAMLPELAEKFGVAELGLFGSRVRGDHRTDSDLDVLVEFQVGRIPGFFGFGDLEDCLTERLGVRVDLVHRPALKPEIQKRVRTEVLPL